MKKRNIILTALTAVFAFSASMFAAFGGVKPATESVKAAEDNTTYWEQYFDVESEGDVTFTSNYAKPSYIPGKIGSVDNGLGVTFNQETTLTYKTPILVDALTRDNTIIEFFPAPLQQSVASGNTQPSDAEFSTTYIRLTNIENRNEYVEIKHFRSGYDVGLSWALVSTNTMQPAGVKKGLVDNTVDKGTPMKGSYTGRIYGSKETNAQPANFSFDSESNTVYTGNPLYNDDKNVIRKLADPNYLLGADGLFKGFSSDYVELSIRFTDIYRVDQPGHVILTKILGQPLQSATFVDKGAPTLVFPKDLGNAELPMGEVGSKYPYWDIVAFDAIDGNITNDIKYSVEYLGELHELTTPTTSEVELHDGYFVPNKKGFYKVTANVKDSKDNEAESIVKEIQVIPVIETLNLELEGGYAYPTTASVGSRISVPSYKVTGGSGGITVDFAVTYNNRSVKIPVVAGAFDVDYAGVYNVTYVVKDYLGTEQVFDYPISTSISNKPVFEDVVVPSAYKKYNYIPLNLPAAYDYASFPGQKVKVESVVEAIDVVLEGSNEVEQGVWTVVDADRTTGEYLYLPSEEAVKVKVRYRACAQLDETAEIITEPKEIVILDPATLVDYWFNADGNISNAYEQKQGGKYKENVFTIEKAGASLEYIVPLQAEGFSIAMTFEEGQAYFEKITVILQDSANANEIITFTITQRTDDTVYLSSPYATYATTTGRMYDVTGSSTVLLKFKLGTQLIDSVGSTVANLTNYDNGDVYTGFSSSKVIAKIVFNEIDDSEGKVNKVKFGQFYSQFAYIEDDVDSAGPLVSTAEHINTYASYMQEVTIPTAKAYDLYCPYTEVYLSVYGPDGNAIISNVLANTEQKIILDKNGRYVVEYKAVDEYDNPTFIQYNVFTLDVIKPVIEIDGQIKSTAKVGDILKLPNYYAKDNFTAPEDMLKYVFLETPTFGYKTIAIGDEVGKYKFQQAGTYNLVYFAMDKASNYAYKTFTITVTN